MTKSNGFIILLIAAITGCMGNNLTNFTRPDNSQIVIGETSRDQIIEIMQKKPDAVGKKMYNNTIVDVFEYSFIGDESQADIKDDNYLPAKTQYYYIEKDIVVGTEFHSSFAIDHTRYDEDAISQVIKGKTTKDEVIQLFGNPGILLGKALVPDSASGAIGYHYRNMQLVSPTDLRTYATKVVFEYDGDGVIQNIEYESSRNNS